MTFVKILTKDFNEASRQKKKTFTEFIQLLLHDQQQTTIDVTFYMCRECSLKSDDIRYLF